MARKRYISTEVSTDACLNNLGKQDLLVPLLYTWLIPHLDDWGRSSGDPEVLLLQIVPGLGLDPGRMEEGLVRLEQAGLLHRYWAGGRHCLAVDPAIFYRAQTYVSAHKRTFDGSAFPPPPDPPWGHDPLPPQTAARPDQDAPTLTAQCESALQVRQLDENCNFAGYRPSSAASPSPSPSPSPSMSLHRPLKNPGAAPGEKPGPPLPHSQVPAAKACPRAQRREIPPAVSAYHRLTGIYPHKSWWTELDTVVGRDGKLESWEKTVIAYLGQGWNKANVANMLDFFRRGVLPVTTHGWKTDRLPEAPPQTSLKAGAWLRLSEKQQKDGVP